MSWRTDYTKGIHVIRNYDEDLFDKEVNRFYDEGYEIVGFHIETINSLHTKHVYRAIMQKRRNYNETISTTTI